MIVAREREGMTINCPGTSDLRERLLSGNFSVVRHECQLWQSVRRSSRYGERTVLVAAVMNLSL